MASLSIRSPYSGGKGRGKREMERIKRDGSRKTANEMEGVREGEARQEERKQRGI